MHMFIEEHQLSLKMHLLLPKRERLGFYMTDIKTLSMNFSIDFLVLDIARYSDCQHILRIHKINDIQK